MAWHTVGWCKCEQCTDRLQKELEGEISFKSLLFSRLFYKQQQQQLRWVTFFVITIHLCMPAIEHTVGPLHLTPMTSVCSLLVHDKECSVLHFYVYAFRGSQFNFFRYPLRINSVNYRIIFNLQLHFYNIVLSKNIASVKLLTSASTEHTFQYYCRQNYLVQKPLLLTTFIRFVISYVLVIR